MKRANISKNYLPKSTFYCKKVLLGVCFLWFFILPLELSANFIKFVHNDFRFSLTGSQSAFENWNQGKTNSLTANSSFDIKQEILIDTINLKIQFEADFGVKYLKDENQATLLPTENRLLGEVLLTYPAGWQVDPFVSASFSTQLTESFRMLNGKKVRTAHFGDPVTSQQSLGFAKSFKREKTNIS